MGHLTRFLMAPCRERYPNCNRVSRRLFVFTKAHGGGFGLGIELANALGFFFLTIVLAPSTHPFLLQPSQTLL